jgi:N-acetylmuramoyl-L-alanine amidase
MRLQAAWKSRALYAAVIAASLAIVLALTARPLNADEKQLEGTLETPDHPAPRPLNVLRIDGVDYLNVHDIALLFRAIRTWYADVGRMVLQVGDKTVELQLGSPFVTVDGEGRNLYSPVIWDEDHMFAPVSFVTEVMDPLVRERMTWDPKSLTLRADSGEPNVSAVAYSKEGDGTAIEVRTARELPCLVEEDSKERKVIARIPGGVLANKILGSFPGEGDVESLKTTQAPGLATLVFELRDGARPLQSANRLSPTKIALRFGSRSWTQSAGFIDTLPRGVVDPNSEGDAQEPVRGFIAQSPRIIRNVLIDPGHGGSDGGSSSSRGDREKDVALQLAQRLRAYLLERAPDLDVRLTREDDRYVSNEERRSMANDWRADVFVSLHCNGWFDKERRGFSVSTWEIPAVNRYWSLPTGAVRIGSITRDTDLLANAILLKMDAALTLPNRGRADADLDVLEGLTMPAVLIECGYLTNTDDRKLLVSDNFQEKTAQAITEGMMEFRSHFAAAWTSNTPEEPPGGDDE